VDVNITRTIPVLISDDDAIIATVHAAAAIKQRLSSTAFNQGKPLSAIMLHREAYHAVAGTLSSQMTCTAIRQVAAAYASAKKNKRPAKKPFAFLSKSAMWLVGSRGRDASFRESTISIWTVEGRKKISYRIPQAFQNDFDNAITIDALVVSIHRGKVKASIAVTLDAPEPAGVSPVGVDLGVACPLVAVDSDGRVFVANGSRMGQSTRRTRKRRARLQRKLAAKKAQKRDSRSVRRSLKLLGRRQRQRTLTFCRETAAHFVKWAPADAVIVFERLKMKKPSKTDPMRKGLRRKLNAWSHSLMRQCVRNAAERVGLAIGEVNPAYTSQTCSRCGLLGNRLLRSFSCPHCGHQEHSDVNAARNIRLAYAVLRRGGPLSDGPEALTLVEGKLSPLGDSI